VENHEVIPQILQVVGELKANFGVKPNLEACGPLLFVGVTDASAIETLSPLVERHFGEPYKPAGRGAFLKNLTDAFVKKVGGIRKEQTLYCREVSPTVSLYCTFWPWGSNPQKVSIRIGLVCESAEEQARLQQSLQAFFG
jgi:hypothetical protein